MAQIKGTGKEMIQVEMTLAEGKEFDNFVEETDSGTRKQYSKECRNIMKWAITQVKRGHTIIAQGG